MDAFSLDMLGSGSGLQQQQQQQSSQVGQLVQGQYIPTAQERPTFEKLFQIADRNHNQSIGGRDAVQFLQLSGLPNPVLKEIWNIAVVDSPEMNQAQFFTVMRLVSLCQMGKQLGPGILTQNESTAAALPKFRGINSNASVQQKMSPQHQVPSQHAPMGQQQPQQPAMGQQSQHSAMGQQSQHSAMGQHSQQQAMGQQPQQPAMAQQHQPPAMGQQSQQPVIGQQHQQPAMGQQHQQPAMGQQHQQPAMGQQHQGMGQTSPSSFQSTQLQASATGASWASSQQQQIQGSATGTSWASARQQAPQMASQPATQQPAHHGQQAHPAATTAAAPPLQSVVDTATATAGGVDQSMMKQQYTATQGVPALHESMASLHQILLQSTERVKSEISVAQHSLSSLSQERTELLASLEGADRALQAKIADLAQLDEELAAMRTEVSGMRRQVQEKSTLVQETEEKIIRKQAEALELQQGKGVRPHADLHQPIAQPPAAPSDPFLADELSRANAPEQPPAGSQFPPAGSQLPPSVPPRTASPPKPPARATPVAAGGSSPFDVGFDDPGNAQDSQGGNQWNGFEGSNTAAAGQAAGGWDSFGADSAFPDDSAAFESPSGAQDQRFDAFDANFDASFDFPSGGGK